MTSGLTPSERFVAGLCERAFLRLWTHPNPKGKKGKELCDCLIVCGPHVVIISVKDNEYRETGDKTGWERWTKPAIEKSEAQIRGAERWLDTVDHVERADGRPITLPLRDKRLYHRVAVALGSRGEIPLKWGDSGSGFVHVCDEYSIGALFFVLDTITDFVEFLRAVEQLVVGGTFPLFAGGGLEDLVALYLLHERSFNFDSGEQNKAGTMLILHNDIWKGLVKSAEFERMRRDLESSYVWDRLIDYYAKDLLTGGMFDMHSQEATDNELALVTMAIQPRLHRAILADALIDFLEHGASKSAARVAQGYADTAFVFMAGSSADRKRRSQELALRCLVVRGRMPGVKTVVGIATDRPGTSSIGYSSDIVYIHTEEWSEKDAENVDGIQRDLGYFQSVSWTR
ncbi:hypothetical protein [Ralstonia solanacearum]|uniref:hypothetical protein n=1 Tax=Ralstonia solanacearum TaxID=305 RepID=UPI0001D952CC|nr:hypothetical protein [Ralstonia solanacearum]CBJ50349.1 hypothethical protein [Ralstonia solanacearum PSI07]